jgi:integration host factor subunit alpha
LKFTDFLAISTNSSSESLPAPKNEHRRSTSMTVTKAKLKSSVSKTSNLPGQISKAVVETFFEIIKRSLESGEDVLISGFGKFCVKDKKERKGRNPETGNDMILDERRIVAFKCSNVLKDKLNAKN